MVPGGRATLRTHTRHVSFGSLSGAPENRLLPHKTKKAAHVTNTMSALEEISKLPGYNDDGTIVVPISAVMNFNSSRLPPGSASGADTG